MAACEGELTVRLEHILLGEIWLAELTGDPVGFFDLRIKDGTGEIYAFFVEPSVSGAGIGRLLWEKLEERATKFGTARLFVESDPHATGFYVRMGCSLVGEVPSGSIAGRMLPRLAKELRAS